MIAMEQLLKRFEYEEITISMITGECGIARQGFYKFYSDKDDLCLNMVLYFAKRKDLITEPCLWQDFVRHELEAICAHRNFYNIAACAGNYDLIKKILIHSVYDVYTRIIEVQSGQAIDSDTAFLLQSYCWGGFEMLNNLFLSRKPIEIEHMISLYTDSMPLKISHYLLNGVFPVEALN